MIETTLQTLLIGTPQPFRGDDEKSAIVKRPVEGQVYLNYEGLEGNEVADKIHHGGRDKAVHLYPIEHYAFWREKYPHLNLLNHKGAFGENLSCVGLTEENLCLGDVFSIGEALIECSHARQPCWKLNHRFGEPDVLKTVVKTTKSGSYFRVLKPGMVQAGDTIKQLERPLANWPLSRVFRLIIGGEHKGQGRALQALAASSALAETWRERAAQLMEIA